jgi:hypothetical protein
MDDPQNLQNQVQQIVGQPFLARNEAWGKIEAKLLAEPELGLRKECRRADCLGTAEYLVTDIAGLTVVIGYEELTDRVSIEIREFYEKDAKEMGDWIMYDMFDSGIMVEQEILYRIRLIRHAYEYGKSERN